jgi:two-component system phosphate regulon response regulator PhoB
MPENARYKIMVVDDDRDITETTALYLRQAGYSVITCFSGDELLRKIKTSQPDLVLSDVMLGDSSGVELCARIRQDPGTRHIPIILVSGSRISEEDTASALYEGADDYLVKPVSPRVVIAKVCAVLRRVKAPLELSEVLRRNGLALNVPERTASMDGRQVQLTRKEFDLLTLLLRKERKVLSSKYLLETVWGYELEDYNDTHTVEVHISSLKKKLGRKFASQITNVIGSGYRLDPS